MNGKVIGGLAVLVFGVWVLAPDLIARGVSLLFALAWPLTLVYIIYLIVRSFMKRPRAHGPSAETVPLTRSERLAHLREEQEQVQADIAALRAELHPPEPIAAAPAVAGNDSAPAEAKPRLGVAS